MVISCFCLGIFGFGRGLVIIMIISGVWLKCWWFFLNMVLFVCGLCWWLCLVRKLFRV